MPVHSPDPSRPRVDVRRLSMAQLQALAERGSRRAQAELDARMATLPPPAVAHRSTPSSRAAPVRPAPARPLAASTPDRLARPPIEARSRQDADAAMNAEAAQEDPRVLQLQMLAQQDNDSKRYRDLPQLIGLLLLIWGLLMLFGGLVMLAHSGGSYYVVLSLCTMAVGWLLWKNSAWAMYLQPVVVLVALGWAWQAGGHSLLNMLVQAAPVWVPACWLPAPQVRDPLV